MGHRYYPGKRQRQNPGFPNLGPELFTLSLLSLLGFPSKMLKPPSFHVHLKDETDETSGLEMPDVSERGFPVATGDTHSTVA